MKFVAKSASFLAGGHRVLQFGESSNGFDDVLPGAFPLIVRSLPIEADGYRAAMQFRVEAEVELLWFTGLCVLAQDGERFESGGLYLVVHGLSVAPSGVDGNPHSFYIW